MNVTLQPGEQEIDTWSIIYRPENGGGPYNGKLKVTNRRLLYDAKFDVSAKGMLAELALIKWGSEGFLEIDKSSIANIEVAKSFLRKQVILTLTDGSRHAFDRGVMNIDPVVEAIRAR